MAAPLIGILKSLEIHNRWQNAYQDVAGSHLSLLLPSGFQPTRNGKGFEHPGIKAHISFNELKGQTQLTHSQRFTASLVPEGGELLQNEEVLINTFPGKFVKFSRTIPSLIEADGEKMMHLMLSFGAKGHLIILTATYPFNQDKDWGKPLEDCLKSVIYDPERPFKGHRQTEEISFQVDTREAGLHLADFLTEQTQEGLTHRLVFTPDGKDLKQTEHRERIVITEKGWKVESPQAELHRLFQNTFFSSFEVLETQELELDQLAGYEAWAIERSHNWEDGQRLAYLVLLFDENRHYELRCWAEDDKISHLGKFRKVCHSFRLQEAGFDGQA
ncbi:MAG: hypothetical protein AAFR61_23795 [Bacteroidota bacterium]